MKGKEVEKGKKWIAGMGREREGGYQIIWN